jgi:hypothetical protein
MFSSLIDPKTSRLLPAYNPSDAEMQPEEFAAMYQMELDLL